VFNGGEWRPVLDTLQGNGKGVAQVCDVRDTGLSLDLANSLIKQRSSTLPPGGVELTVHAN